MADQKSTVFQAGGLPLSCSLPLCVKRPLLLTAHVLALPRADFLENFLWRGGIGFDPALSECLKQMHCQTQRPPESAEDFYL